MSEREKIVAWLRREARRISDNVPDQRGNVEPLLHIRLAASLSRAADAVERGDHLKRPEPTIPASEWMPKSNLTY